MIKKSKILVVSAHPDDETLGCGGTILKHKAALDAAYWLIMTNMLKGEHYSTSRFQARQKEIDAIAKDYGFKEVFKLNLPTTQLDTIPLAKMARMVQQIIARVNPQQIYLPYKNDIHSDHRITFDVLMSSLKTFRCPWVKKVLMYEVISETEFTPPFKDTTFVPNSFSDISDYLQRKIEIMCKYKGEISRHPFPRSTKNIKALATFRGATAGVKYAEAFMVLKEIW